MILAIFLSHYGKVFSLMLGAFLLTLLFALILITGNISLQYLILTSLSIFGFNLGIILTFMAKYFNTEII